ncbi:MAG: hypothetical protein V4485_05235 [Pseudomonadota bacterium]
MSPQIIELLLFAAVAFFLINKLMSILGTTTKEEQARFKDSIFGEPSALKDVTSKSEEIKLVQENLDEGVVVSENKVSILENLHTVRSRMPSFELTRFVGNARTACRMLIGALQASDKKTLEQFVDKRFIKSFETMSGKYEAFTENTSLDAKVSELYMFGHNVFVKILFTTTPNFSEEWTFTKNIQNQDPDWFLSSIT